MGGLDVAVRKAAELASVAEHGLVHIPKQKDFIELLMEDLSSVSSPEVALPEPLEQVMSPAEDALLLQAIFASGDVAAMLPGRLEIR